MGKKSKRKGGGRGKGVSSSSFPVPPRSVEDIIGPIGPSAAATKAVVAELGHALRCERSSDAHRDAVARAAKGESPVTYETPGMLDEQLGGGGTSRSRLVCGRGTPFHLSSLELPACEATVLNDAGMGQANTTTNWAGGECLMLEFDESSGQSVRTCMFAGECQLVQMDIWDLAVQFRADAGKFPWPCCWSVLQCPFCAELAAPGDPKQTFMMIIQTLTQNVVTTVGRDREVTTANRDLPRLCCKECFLGNLRNPSGWELGGYPDMLRKGLPALHFGEDQPHALKPSISAYQLNALYSRSGIGGAVSKETIKALKQAVSRSGNFKAKVSKSRTKDNRDQAVVVMKSVQRKMCAACGVSSTKLSKCSGCKQVHFCGRACQERAWKSHKMMCKKLKKNPSLRSDVDLTRIPSETGSDLPRKSSELCKRCQTNPDDEGCPAMCVQCGTFVVCGPCAVKPDMGGKNGFAPSPFFACAECQPKMERNLENLPGPMLQRLLDERPEGPHVLYARLQLAQCKLNSYKRFTGIKQDVDAAKKEYLRLADGLGYSLAQFAMGSFHDPLCRSQGEIWDGPIDFGDIRQEFGLPRSPFKPDRKKALEYYKKAVENDLTIAIQSVGTMYKNGENFPVNKPLAASMLEKAALRGDPRAMCNIGQMLMRGDGIPENRFAGIDWYTAAADQGIYSAMFMIAQLGMQIPLMREEGEKMMKKLDSEEWEPPNPDHAETWFMLRDIYGMD